jgi:flagellar motor switch protein FliG
MTPSSPETLQRAAILVAALDPDLADQLLDQMPSDEAARVRRAIMELGDVDSSQERDVIDAFLANDSAPAAAAAARNELVESAPAETSEDEGVELHLSSAAASHSLSQPAAPRSPCFQFLHNVERSQLVELLASEHPRTVAIVAAHLSEECATSLLAALLPASREEVVRRFSESAVTDPLVLSEIEQSLRDRLSVYHAAAIHKPADLQRISRVLTAVDEGAKRQVSSSDIELTPTSIASDVNPATFGDPLAMTFADLEYLDQELLSATLRRSDAEIVRLALAGATAEFVQKVLNRLSLREARYLRRQIETIGPTRLSDMECAQVALARLAERVLIEALHGAGPSAASEASTITDATHTTTN